MPHTLPTGRDTFGVSATPLGSIYPVLYFLAIVTPVVLAVCALRLEQWEEKLLGGGRRLPTATDTPASAPAEPTAGSGAAYPAASSSAATTAAAATRTTSATGTSTNPGTDAAA